MKVTVIGTGYVGLVTGTCLAEMGNAVTCVDIDPRKIDMLNNGELPIYEPGLDELVHRNAKSGRLTFTLDLSDGVPTSDVVFIAVGTPPDEDGSADRRYVLEAAASIARLVTHDIIVAVKSTVPVGTCDRVQDVINDILTEQESPHTVTVVSNPEFLKEGKAVDDFMRPDRIVVGANHEHAAKTMDRLYAPFVRNGHPVIKMSVRSSEMTKYAANVMLATRISLINELARLCDSIGADIMDIRKGIGTDRRIGMEFLYAGIGYGGSCFPKDVKALAQVALEADTTAHVLEAVEQVNKQQKLVLANRIINHFGGSLKGKRVALWGLSFKANTDDIRESSALSILKRLHECGAEIVAFDPIAMENAQRHLGERPKISYAKDMYQATEDADVLVLCTEWNAFKSFDTHRVKGLMKSPLMFDGRNQFEPEYLRSEGFEYYGIGRGR